MSTEALRSLAEWLVALDEPSRIETRSRVSLGMIIDRAREALAADEARPRRYDQCDDTCTTDCGHCKGRGRSSGEAEMWECRICGGDRGSGRHFPGCIDAPVASGGETEIGEADSLREKFRVERLTPSSRGIDHSACRYFVLDPQHDPHAVAALRAYADACAADKPALAADLREWAGPAPVSSGGQADGEGEAVKALLESDAMTANTDGTPTHYIVEAENVEYLVGVVLAAARPVLSREATSRRPSSRADVERIADHLADVLTAD